MLRLYTLWELERELSPEDFQHILTPEAALEKATVSYDLDYRNYTYPPLGEVPRELVFQKTSLTLGQIVQYTTRFMTIWK